MLGEVAAQHADHKNHPSQQQEDFDRVVEKEVNGPREFRFGVHSRPIVNQEVDEFCEHVLVSLILLIILLILLLIVLWFLVRRLGV